MEAQEILKITSEYIKKAMYAESSGHDWWHIYRVHNLALKINEKENKNPFVISMIALLHDIFDEKFSTGNIRDNLINLMKELEIYDSLSKEDLENILHSVENLGFKGGFNTVSISYEGKIVQDADRIDAIGAIGIARTFAYGGKKGIPIYNPDQGIVEITSQEEYRNLKTHTINHFYEKLLKLKDTLNTECAKEIAEKRTAYMQEFLNEFYSEWNLTN